jgi:hypothetical protein
VTGKLRFLGAQEPFREDGFIGVQLEDTVHEEKGRPMRQDGQYFVQREQAFIVHGSLFKTRQNWRHDLCVARWHQTRRQQGKDGNEEK